VAVVIPYSSDSHIVLVTDSIRPTNENEPKPTTSQPATRKDDTAVVKKALLSAIGAVLLLDL
jgi:hypothetical protein